MKRLKLYLDTSVWNFYYADDAPEKMELTKSFFHNFGDAGYEVYSSAVVIREIENADEQTITELTALMSKHPPVLLEVNDEIDELANLNKKEKVRAVNILNGYLKELEMITPLEVIGDE